jgi:hypothetical protein
MNAEHRGFVPLRNLVFAACRGPRRLRRPFETETAAASQIVLESTARRSAALCSSRLPLRLRAVSLNPISTGKLNLYRPKHCLSPGLRVTCGATLPVRRLPSGTSLHLPPARASLKSARSLFRGGKPIPCPNWTSS